MTGLEQCGTSGTDCVCVFLAFFKWRVSCVSCARTYWLHAALFFRVHALLVGSSPADVLSLGKHWQFSHTHRAQSSLEARLLLHDL